MSGELSIRPCTPDDVNKLSRVAIRAYKDFYLYLWDDDGSWYINRSFLPSVLEEEVRDPQSAFFFVCEKEEPIGFIKLNVDRAPDRYSSDEWLELERIYLFRSATGKGYGRKALEFCFDFARARGKRYIWLKTMDSSSAVKVYQRMGFVVFDQAHLSFEIMKTEYRGMLLMKKQLDA